MAARPGTAALSRRRPLKTAVALALLLGGCASPTASPQAGEPTSSTAPAPVRGYLGPVRLGLIQDPAIDEASGMAASRTSPGMLWVHNDSGDGALVYCVTRTGGRCGTWAVSGAAARDWEDMAVGPGPEQGVSYLYLGDIGDNESNQGGITVYRVPEPVAGAAGTSSAPRSTGAATALRLRYEDGPHDAEALLVHPQTADLYVVTKDVPARVYQARAQGVLGLVDIVDLPEGEWVTGGDISPDGRRVLLSTLLGGLELELPAGARGFDEVWSQPTLEIELGRLAQLEAAAYRLDGEAVLATSEKSPAPLQEAVRARAS